MLNAEPLRFLFVSDFPNGFTPKAIASLRSLLSNGTDTGIFVFMSRCNEDWESGGSAYRSFVDTPLNSITDAVTHCDLLLNKSYARSAQIYSPILSTVPSHQEFIPLVLRILLIPYVKLLMILRQLRKKQRRLI